MNLRVLSTLCSLALCLATFPALADEEVSYEYLKPGIRSFKGVEFVNVQGGTDFRVSEELWLGPFVTFTMGKYVNVDEARFHGWLMGGLRLSIR